MISTLSRTIEAMTMPFTLSLASTDKGIATILLEEIIPQLVAELERLEDKFSAFREESMVSRFQSGDQSVLMDQEFQMVYARVRIAEDMTDSYFDPYYKGAYDPTGYVKGWIIEKLFNQLLKPLLSHEEIIGISLNGAGDLQLASKSADFTWKIGVENPFNLQEVLTIYPLTNGALATSGVVKRGNHIKMKDLHQVTVVSAQLSEADMWATALMAAGLEHSLSLMAKHHLSGCLVTSNMVVWVHDGQILNQRQLRD